MHIGNFLIKQSLLKQHAAGKGRHSLNTFECAFQILFPHIAIERECKKTFEYLVVGARNAVLDRVK